MATARATQVDLSVTPYYHCISRCVRRAFLCGEDAVTGKSFEHRKGWLADRIRHLGTLFAVDVCAYAIMSNHFHLVLRVREDRAREWSEDEVLRRYGKLFPMAVSGLELLAEIERTRRIELFRARLCDLSWMMRSLNEWLARRANKEDGVKGRFWEGRFRSQALLDDQALLTCMAYVDLNPVRAGLAEGLEDSEFTSIQERLWTSAQGRTQSKAAASRESKAKRKRKASSLAHFQDQLSPAKLHEALPMLLSDYVRLLEWTGRALRSDKRGRISGPPPHTLTELEIDSEAWLETMRTYQRCFFHAVGSAEELERHAERAGKSWLRGKGWAKRLFSAA